MARTVISRVRSINVYAVGDVQAGTSFLHDIGKLLSISTIPTTAAIATMVAPAYSPIFQSMEALDRPFSIIYCQGRSENNRIYPYRIGLHVQQFNFVDIPTRHLLNSVLFLLVDVHQSQTWHKMKSRRIIRQRNCDVSRELWR